MFKFFLVVAVCALIVINFVIATEPQSPKPEVKQVTVTKVVTNPGLPAGYKVFYDSERGATCYYKEYYSNTVALSLSCIPSNQLRK